MEVEVWVCGMGFVLRYKVGLGREGKEWIGRWKGGGIQWMGKGDREGEVRWSEVRKGKERKGTWKEHIEWMGKGIGRVGSGGVR